jgi:hypothetical protein
MQDNICRPKAEKRKIHSKNEFELCYLRHQYFRRVTENPTKEDLKPFSYIATHMAKNTFYTYRNLFGMIGFELEDVINIAHVHLVSFLGLYSLEKMPQKYCEFVAKHKIDKNCTPNQSDVLQKNRANCTIFLKQRMEDVVRVCRQKARNIKGLPTEEYFFYYGPKRPPTILRDLVGNHEKYGYRKLDTAVYKSIRKQIRIDDSSVFKFNGNYYVAVPVEQKSLSLSDFCGADMDPYDSIHNMSPEQIFFNAEEISHWEKKKEEFDRTPKYKKAAMIRNFIEKNKENPDFKDELNAARKLLKSIGT